MEIVGYVYGGEKTKRKKRKKKIEGNAWIKERKRIRNGLLEILLQYFYKIFKINFK